MGGCLFRAGRDEGREVHLRIDRRMHEIVGRVWKWQYNMEPHVLVLTNMSRSFIDYWTKQRSAGA
jgi:hypothetical protein